MKLSPEVERRKSNPYTVVALFVLLGCTLGAVGGVSVLRLWPRGAPVIQKTAPLSACSDGQRLAWRLATTGLTGGEWACEPSTSPNDDYYATFGGADEYFRKGRELGDCPPDEVKTARDGEWSCERASVTVDRRDWVIFTPDPATQCRRTVRDGKSKIIGTYLGECGHLGGDLTIMGFEPAP